MPWVHSIDAKIYYEVKGEGPTLVLLEGLGYSSWMWLLQIDNLAKDHKLVVIDNRGVGKSDKPTYPYTMDMFATDVKNVLDHIGIDKAHILGVSMGGMIAQQFFFRFPEKVKSLILIATHHGGRDIEPPSEEVVRVILEPPKPHMNLREYYRYKMVNYAISGSWVEKNREIFELLLDLRVRDPLPAVLNQLHAVAKFDLSKEVENITVPTLIIHGANDRVVPISNAYRLFSKIKTSTFVIFKEAQHLVHIEKAKEVNQLVRDFIRKVEEGVYVPKRDAPTIIEDC